MKLAQPGPFSCRPQPKSYLIQAFMLSTESRPTSQTARLRDALIVARDPTATFFFMLLAVHPTPTGVDG
ncbi:hypothetical protein [Spirosoma sp. 48-14]|uniref:hypothetical protein n=1 Tax=Spirosoma sp. 48-14 TaxID=1895854 RepID=UPI0025D5536A|nr:hypothetical protein [Spirosoma sp. 48-14]